MNRKVVQKIDQNLNGRRFDDAAAILFEITKSRSNKLIRQGVILLNGDKAIPKKTLKKGDLLKFSVKKNQSQYKIPILFEDRYLLVVNKPAGLTVHPADGEREKTMTEILSEKSKKEYLVVHRLDKGTSGVMILAKTENAKIFLQDQFKTRKIKKSYLTLIEGLIQPETGVIDIPLAREEIVRNKIGPTASGKSALTNYQVVEYYKDYSYLEVNPKTGRTHQIRAHFSAIGYPVVGDERYGKKSTIVPRIFLHAFAISFIHPKELRRVSFVSPLPKDLNDVLLGLK